MAISSKVYGPALQSMLAGEVNYLSATVRAMLTTSSYVPNQDTHRYKSSVTNEVTGSGYAAGGVTLTSKTATYDTATNTVTLDAADPSWSSATFTFRYLVFYIDTGGAATSPLLTYVDFEVDQTVTTSTFTYQLPAGGLAQFTAA